MALKGTRTWLAASVTLSFFFAVMLVIVGGVFYLDFGYDAEEFKACTELAEQFVVAGVLLWLISIIVAISDEE